ncbi:tRNA uridine-5-carboxymethylaminomethyl(34) synthesis GTPase MnmE [Luteolibacter pohnpeiensis]|uniref:tRNA modification GTPase MnmE n=1 Tax=Luteolibacter pohnpeiensis TaxID=454153 RepID=A0A934VTQ8_9BACT|nr:tRNA uridine-5-carboxymethylaminomethyl(34) synthesis GTPase MnmE [Luteolibacter pohnpeiensis]MBK1881737.1 tRNA uridine-5-carboxymethylaminomethyl(34) synthesis GTPase MnmE [Luteolibacter pohnpeiensis]
MQPLSENRSTIAAVASPSGTGAVSMIRLSGPRAIQIADRATRGKAAALLPRTVRHCRIFDEQQNAIDDGLITVFHAPHSFTGEDCVEFTGHGGMLVTREVLGRFLECGAIPAGPGEFTQRAFINGKLDLTQAEGIMDLISAQTRLSMRAARSQLEGTLGKRTTEARDQLLETLAHLEAWIDFPEEDIDPQTGQLLISRIRSVLDTVRSLLATADQGRVLREGVRTVIFGEPNVGKSSLLNRLLGFDRAIVSDVAGTTRDTIEEIVNLHGLPLRLIDTAGVREAGDQIEAEGIQRTVRQIESADLLLEIYDASQPKPSKAVLPHTEAKKLLVLNKTDLGENESWSGVEAVRLSCSTGSGFDELSAAIRDALHFNEADWGEHSVAINARHQASLQTARNSLIAALDLIENEGADPELAAIDLREALDALGEIPGRVDTEDLLGVIFSSFCIGK